MRIEAMVSGWLLLAFRGSGALKTAPERPAFPSTVWSILASLTTQHMLAKGPQDILSSSGAGGS
jgi:hypothetical protein